MTWLKDHWFQVLAVVAMCWVLYSNEFKRPKNPPDPTPVPSVGIFSKKIQTVEHDGHKYVTFGECVLHHPDCPCLAKRRDSP